MNVIFLTVFGIYVLLSEGRLLDENTVKINATTDNSQSEHRVQRDISEEEGLANFSKEIAQTIETRYDLNQKLRYSIRPKHKTQIKLRIPRDSEEKIQKVENKTVNNGLKVVLVKKPIPKFNEIDYDEDFQMNLNKLPIKLSESADHDDEDFNVDDYDFDVNHDEYASKGKLLEAKAKTSHSQQHDQLEQTTEIVKPKPKPPIIKKQRKTVLPVIPESRKAKPKSNKNKKVSHKPKEMDYYDDTSTSTKAPDKKEIKQRDYEEYTEDSKEYDRKPRSIKSWRKAKLPRKMNHKSPHILSILPMFPRLAVRDYTIPDSDILKIESYDLSGKSL